MMISDSVLLFWATLYSAENERAVVLLCTIENVQFLTLQFVRCGMATYIEELWWNECPPPRPIGPFNNYVSWGTGRIVWSVKVCDRGGDHV